MPRGPSGGIYGGGDALMEGLTGVRKSMECEAFDYVLTLRFLLSMFCLY